MSRPWDDVGGTPCPQCGQPTGTVMRHAEEHTPSGPIDMCYTFYKVEPHGRMGNKSNREDHFCGVYCPTCGYDNADWHAPPSLREELRRLTDIFIGFCQFLLDQE